MRSQPFRQLRRSARQRRLEESARRLLAQSEHQRQIAVVRAHVR
ncbi:MAG TPA: hypothetical protein PLA46_05025 [Phycicoccus sp.]|nr:hypothetical protein [Phycicoccus sp.]HQH06599.1 hypothetical protein [Phycicoccus sp.]HQK30122.1 hypothetical protein [Phycicoccus sp.]HQV90925.1 hypothetical protein [Phycicoccus sp.]HQY95554.1 hypothetical protein [Phycicoccus sp.]